MKSKLKGAVGIGLTLILLASLVMGLSAPAGAAPATLKWTKLTLPKVEVWNPGALDGGAASFAKSEGNFWATPGIDVGPIALSPDGKTLFAAVAPDPYIVREVGTASDWYNVLKSTDGGYSWVATGFYDEWDDAGDSSPIVDIVVSPDYKKDTTIVVATMWTVYQSVDGGKNFVCMDNTPAWSGARIRDLDVALDTRGRLAIMVGTEDVTWGGAGDVYVFSTRTGLKWTAQNIGAYDVLACAFSPIFAVEEGICAVVTDHGDPMDATDGTTKVRFSFANTTTGGGWGADIADAPITDARGFNFESAHARIAFPDDFDPWGVGNNVCFVGVYSWEGYDNYNAPDYYDLAKGDVYKIVLKEAGTSSAIDLDIRGVITTLLPTVTDITSIDVCGDAEDATIVVGTDRCDLGATPEQFLVYYSTDSGKTWAPSLKSPTGGTESTADLMYLDVMTDVVMAPDFCTSGIAYAGTWGAETSALSRTNDSGNSWNQISIIDYASDAGYVVTPFGFSAAGYNADGALHMTTTATGGNALWKRTGGKNWERILSYANAGVTDTLFQLIVLPDAIFAVDWENKCMWRSTDNGATWPKKITTKPNLTWVTAVSATTLYTGHENGGLWWSTKSGVGWTKPDDSEIPGTATVCSIAVDGDFVLASTDKGTVFISSNSGKTVEKVGKTAPGVAGSNLATFDLGFADNKIIYNTTADSDNGVWRCEVDLDDPGASEWVQIDSIQNTTPYNYTTVVTTSPAIALPPSGVLFVIDGADVDITPADTAGGLWRSTNPTADVDSPVYPYFEKENKGLSAGDSLSLLSLDVFPTTLFCSNATAEYWEQVVMFTDTLDSGVTLADPANNAVGVGLIPAGYVYPEVILSWQEMAGATSYQYQVAIDSNFKSRVDVPDDGFTPSLASPGLHLQPNKTYYWRVRVANDGSLIGAPLISPWSEVWKFKTAIGAVKARPELEAPWPGEPDVSITPTFEWSGIEWAVKYDFELATDPATGAGGYFTDALVAKTGTNALVSTAWKSDTTLQYGTRYYWHVKAIGEDTETPWSDVGTFTTMGVPPEPVEPVPPIVVPPTEQITPAWIWAIIIIGALLVIAVIILIVTTRRVP